MKQDNSIINIDEIRNIYKEYCEEIDKDFRESEFKKFLNFLEIDFYDWIKENLRQF